MRFINGLIKWVVVILAGLSTALLAIIFLSNNPVFTPFLLRLTILIAIGLFSGLAARLLFSKVIAALTILLTWLANLISLLIIDLFYETSYQLDFIRGSFDFSAISISDGGQILLMGLVSLLPILILRQKQKKTASTKSRSKTKRARKPLSATLKPVLYQVNPQNWKIFAPKPKTKTAKKKTQANAQLKTATKKKSNSKTKVTRPSKPAPVSTVTIARPPTKAKPVTKIKSNGRKPAKVKPAARKLKLPAAFAGSNGNDVKLVGEEEHVCPYCLEEVVKGDERGVVVCPECGTWHHQDCWNLTGSCGVAHRNEL